MKIETGKFYKTRDGQKARVLATDVDALRTVVAALAIPEGGERVIRLMPDGCDFKYGESSSDLVAPWVDKPQIDRSILPAWANKAVAMDSNGKWYCHSKKSVEFEASGLWETAHGQICHIPDSHAPKWEGRPEDSLIVFEDEEGAK